MTVLTKRDMTEHLCNSLGLNKIMAKQLIEEVFEALSNCLENQEIAKIAGFGSFTTRNKPARMGRNPQDGNPLVIAPRCVVSFKASLKLRSKLEKLVGIEGTNPADNQ